MTSILISIALWWVLASLLILGVWNLAKYVYGAEGD